MIKRILTAALSSLLIIAALFTGSCGSQTSNGNLTVRFLKIGKADSMIIRHQDKTLVIDAGEEDDSEEILNTLKNTGAKRIDALIITHFDKDHVGGAAKVVSGIDVERVLLPAYTKDSDEFTALMAALANTDVVPELIVSPVNFDFGDARVYVWPPESYAAAGTWDGADNELSLIASVEHGDVKMLFTGDAMDGRIAEWLEGEGAKKYDLVKIPHHGVYSEKLEALLTRTAPEYAVICDSGKNPADEKTLTLLGGMGVKAYETKDGDITATSDGHTLRVSQ